LDESASFKVYVVKIHSPVFAVGINKKKVQEREEKDSYTKSQVAWSRWQYEKQIPLNWFLQKLARL